MDNFQDSRIEPTMQHLQFNIREIFQIDVLFQHDALKFISAVPIIRGLTGRKQVVIMANSVETLALYRKVRYIHNCQKHNF